MKLSAKFLFFSVLGICWGMVLTLGFAGPAQAVLDPMERPSIKMQSGKAVQSLLLAVTKVGTHLVAVGERGVILLSDDDGKSWRQAQVPVSVTLTAVCFVTPKTGWAVGHSGIVIRSDDGGETWTKQLDGVKAAQMSLDAAKNRLQQAKGNLKALKKEMDAAQLLVADGPDKPFLDIYFKDEKVGFIIGAYNLIFRTDDGGNTWQPWQDRVENPRGLHLYAMREGGNDLYVAGEQGLFLRSSDGGQFFRALSTPYVGTYFGLNAGPDGTVLVYGLQGNAFWSGDRGATWKVVKTGATQSIAGGIWLRDGRLVVVAQSGEVLMSKDNGRTFEPVKVDAVSPFVDLTEAGNGNLLLVGARGVTRISLPSRTDVKGGAQ